MSTVVLAAMNGLVVGASLALVAAGLALLFGVFDILNLAQGDYYMLGGYVLWLGLSHGVNFWLAAIVAVILVGVVGGLALMAMLWPLRDRPQALVLLGTLALSLIIEQLATDYFGAAIKTVPAPVHQHLTIGSAQYPAYDLVVVVAAAAILGGGFLLLRYHKYGIWIRAVAQNRTMANVLGLPVSRVYAVAFVVSSALAAAAGTLLVPVTELYPTVGMDITVNALIVVIAGGLGNFRGAAAIAFALGLVESIGSIWFRGEAVQLLAFALVIVLLILRSQRQNALVRL